MSEIKPPFTYFADPTRSRALFNASLYFGLPDTDPTIPSNQKLVRAVQEDGTLVSLSQPVSTNTGGIPTYNGSPVRLDVSGDYSYRAFNSSGTLVYEASRVENPEPESDGFSGVVVIENQTLTSGQTTVTFANVGANESVFYLQTFTGDQGFLAKGIDYTVTNSTTIELASSYNTGDVVVGRQNDPTGQLVPVDDAQYLFIFPDLASAQTAATNGNLDAGDTITLNGNPTEGDGLGGDKYKVIATAFPNDDVNYIDLNGTLQLALQSNYYRFQNYSETKATATLNAGTISVDFNSGLIQTVTLTENVTDITFANNNPDSDFSSSVTLRMIQDGTGGRTVTWPAAIIWPGGSSPTVTSTANAIDLYGFTTYDAGSTWYGFTLGQDFK